MYMIRAKLAKPCFNYIVNLWMLIWYGVRDRPAPILIYIYIYTYIHTYIYIY